jgi:hypothetical protein
LTNKPKKQYEQVIEVMVANGGFATLGYLYQNVDVTSWATKTPFSSINRIVQDSRFFFRIKPGLWALNSHRNSVLAYFEIDKAQTKEADDVFTHSYYQGLLLEIGNLRGYQTFVPNQDKNKHFLSKPLFEVSTLGTIHDFGYENFVRRARTIDVIWFNDRKMPSSFFEVEHSTDFFNSLIKFADLTDFHASFCIVADAARRREYEQKISSSVFSKVKGRFEFLSYDQLADLHTYESKMSKTGRLSFLQH